jgi:hypoxanthine phosphoribosyltransferase
MRAPVQTLISKEDLERRVSDLARELNADYAPRVRAGGPFVVVGVLKGSFIFIADLVRRLDVPHELDFISVSSYGNGTSSSGAVRLLKDLDTDIGGRDVLLVEDIVDTGSSLSYIRHNLEIRKPASLRVCALLDKRERRVQDVSVDYVGFLIPDRFVVGYGLDYAERYRELPYIAELDPSEIAP